MNPSDASLSAFPTAIEGKGGPARVALELLHRLPALVMAVDQRDVMQILFWSRECERVSGYLSSEIASRPTAAALLYPDAAYRSRKLAEWQQKGADAHGSFELTLTTRTGKRCRIVWVACSGFTDELGRGVHWLLGQDITALSDAHRQARAQQRLLASVFRHLPDIVSLKDGQGRWLLASPATSALIGVTEQELIGHTAAELVERGCPAADALRHSAAGEEAAWQAGRSSRTEELIDDGSGDPRSFDVLRVPTFGRQGQRLNMLVIRRDTSEQRASATQLELAGRVLDQSSDGIIITDARNRITMVNAAFTRITGYEAAEALDRPPSMLASGLHDAAFFRAMWHELKRSGRWSGEVWNRRKSGEVYPLWMNLSMLQHRISGEVTHYVSSFSDLSSRKAAERQIALLSTQDPITGLPNRSQLALSGALALGHAKTAGEQLALMVIDVDNFKTLNESLSHTAGDQMLREIGQRLVRAAGEHATVGRLSGDEFLVLLPGIAGTTEAAQTAHNLMLGVGEPMVLRELPFNITVSIGIALFPADGDSFDRLFGRADAALYAAKRSGRAAYQFSSVNMNQVALERLQMEAALRRAIDNRLLRLEYQPLVEVASGRIIGCEALCRWDDPERGAVAPEVFIAVAEENGLIEALGGWVLSSATWQLRAWRDAGHTELMLAVNLSARQFQRGVVLDQVQDALRASGIPSGRLELELTETVLLNEGEAVIDTLRQLKALGVSLAIDDFGTGYSSFSYLRRFKFDKLKIDQSFIRDLLDDPDDAAIVRGIISLGQSLGLDVLAEGVESEALAECLRKMDCIYAQGYFYSRPLRPEAMLSLLDAQTAREREPE